MDRKIEVVLLLGPSGVGKSPLGDLLEARGLGERRCVHFDFGAQLRRLVAENRPDRWVSSDEIEFLRGVLESGALLEEGQLPLAERILQSRLAQWSVDRSTLVILNGLPRHAGQTVVIESVLKVVGVIVLTCDEETILRRIEHDVGGDRAGRDDDGLEQVRSRYRLYEQRIAPLVDHYDCDSVRILRVVVRADMSPEEVYDQVCIADWLQ
jgi:adenylate kinase family enzyme